jgi:hypothetical protein
MSSPPIFCAMVGRALFGPLPLAGSVLDDRAAELIARER